MSPAKRIAEARDYGIALGLLKAAEMHHDLSASYMRRGLRSAAEMHSEFAGDILAMQTTTLSPVVMAWHDRLLKVARVFAFLFPPVSQEEWDEYRESGGK